ncbi:hypothetical protein LQU94_05215 [Peptoniphilus sp. KCTC 25270]|uniref:Sau3AI family type II restriction endonuclease n=1 Tax=Peptoniphilus sp. KCTC 25270 TaxID=2897414 RepID=UPI001E54D881|nr:Sau3AI family type II restriction endonuclease [Peptoniphilus sp. KCTC 25270]MCD1147509.1 hypothetical protein [Peptoniphilus sp. KCTC 25270]
MNEYNRDDILSMAETVYGKSVKDIDKKHRSEKETKGMIGHIIEESVYGFDINSRSEADFKELGIELKTTPLKRNKNGSISAKERLVLNIINYMKEAHVTFETSSFWTKNQEILLYFYLWEKGAPIQNFKVLKAVLLTYSEEDLSIIRNDWEIIHHKILSGKAHELSEGDTMYLGACTKGVNAKSMRQQPFSPILAKQRAYSLKQSYMTTIARQHLDSEELERITDKRELREKSFEEILHARFNPYIGMSVEEISQNLGLELNSAFKSKVQQLTSKILDIRGNKLDSIEEFSKANIVFKTIRLNKKGVPKESMSFKQIDFKEWLELPFEESEIYNTFETTKFLFVVFQFDDEENLIFKGIKLWNMPEETIQGEIYGLWKDVRDKLEKGVKLEKSSRGIKNNLPDSSFNGVAHIRPKARNAEDKVQLPDGQMITKQTYWLNSSYVAKIVSDIDGVE